MAKKGKGKSDSTDLGDLGGLEDFEDGLGGDDFGFDDDFGDLGGDDFSRPDSSGKAAYMAEQFGEGFKESFLGRIAKKSLPDEYDYHSSDVQDYFEFSKEVLSESKDRIEKSMYRLGKEVRKILPMQSKMLEDFIARYEDQNLPGRATSEEEMRQSAIASDLSAIFDKQTELQKVIEAKRGADNEVSQRQSIASAKMNIELLGSIESQVAQQTAFTVQVSREYYRKSLELQFKSYFVQVDQLKTTRDAFTTFAQQFDSLIKNTSLPDVVKIHELEKKGIAIEPPRYEVKRSGFSNSEFVNRAKENIGKLIKSKVSEGVGEIDQLTDMIGMLTGNAEDSGGMTKLILGIGSAMVGSAAAEKLADKIAPKIRERIKDNKTINAGAGYLETLGNSPRTLFETLRGYSRKKVEEYENADTPGAQVGANLFSGLDAIFSAALPREASQVVKGSGLLQHNQAAVFDNKVHRSISETIPMYLARILRENTRLAGMYQTVNAGNLKGFVDPEELVYNYGNRKLETIAAYRASAAREALVGPGDKGKLERASRDILSATEHKYTKSAGTLTQRTPEYKAKQKLLKSPTVQRDLTDFLQAAGQITGLKQDYKSIILESLDDREEVGAPELKAMLEKRPELKKALRLIKANTKADDRDAQLYSDRIHDATQTYPIKDIKTLFLATSELANSGSKGGNIVLNNDEATAVAKIFARYIERRKMDITPDDIVNGNVLSYVYPEEERVVEKKYRLFLYAASSIVNGDDPVAKSRFLVALGAVNVSLRSAGGDGKVFQILHDLDPRLVGKGTLTEANLIEKSLDIIPDRDRPFMDRGELRRKYKMKKADVNTAQSKLLSEFAETSLYRYGDTLREEIAKAGYNPKKIAAAIIGSRRELVKGLAETGDILKKATQGPVKEIKEAFNAITEESAKEATAVLGAKFKEAGKAIEKSYKEQKDELLKELSVLEEEKSRLVEQLGHSVEIERLTKDIESKRKVLGKLDTAISKLAATMARYGDSISEASRASAETKVGQLVEKVRDIAKNGLQELEAIVAVDLR